MRGYWIWCTLIILAIAAAFYFWAATDDCNARDGALVRGATGFVCVEQGEHPTSDG